MKNLGYNTKLTCYCFAIHYLERKENKFICTALRSSLLLNYSYSVDIKNIEQLFPELNRYLPLDGKDRIEVLKKCIKDLKDGKEK